MLGNMQTHVIEEQMLRVRQPLLFRRYTVQENLSDEQLRMAVRGGVLVRVHHGSYMPQEEWLALREEERLMARTLSHAHLHGRRAVYSHHSAAAIWGLPLYHLRDEQVHVLTSRSSRGRSSAGVRRHADEWEDDEVCDVGGLRVTSLERTVRDIACTRNVELAVAVADAGLRKLTGATREPSSLVDDWKAKLHERLDRRKGRHGISRAKQVIAFADARADSPIESVSRLQLNRLRVEAEIQALVEGPGWRKFWLDFAFTGQNIFGEVDGRVKYTDPEMLGGRSLEEILLEEKEREDLVRGITGCRVVRWGAADIISSQRLGRRLLACGVRVPALE